MRLQHLDSEINFNRLHVISLTFGASANTFAHLPPGAAPPCISLNCADTGPDIRLPIISNLLFSKTHADWSKLTPAHADQSLDRRERAISSPDISSICSSFCSPCADDDCLGHLAPPDFLDIAPGRPFAQRIIRYRSRFADDHVDAIACDGVPSKIPLELGDRLTDTSETDRLLSVRLNFVDVDELDEKCAGIVDHLVWSVQALLSFFTHIELRLEPEHDGMRGRGRSPKRPSKSMRSHGTKYNSLVLFRNLSRREGTFQPCCEFLLVRKSIENTFPTCTTSHRHELSPIPAVASQ